MFKFITKALNPTKNWSAVSLGQIAMGHEVAVTALQLAMAYSAIANGGYLLKPLLIRNILNQSNGCKVIDERKDGGYITPLEAENSYLTFISRIRKDSSNNKAINMWVVYDNLLKGAALNTVQIAEQLIKINV